ncbi:MAG: hypothetical protein ABF856_16755 [Acetobacter aceti]
MTTRPGSKPEQPPASATQTPPRALTAPARIHGRARASCPLQARARKQLRQCLLRSHAPGYTGKVRGSALCLDGLIRFLRFPPLYWRASHASLLRRNSPPDDSYMIPVGALERQKAACAAF